MANPYKHFFNKFVAGGTLLASVSFLGATAAHAEDYPNKPIELIVASSAGGILDTVSRLAGRGIEQLGQPVVPKNAPGGGGTIATGMGARADADGYTIVGIATSHGINPSIYPDLQYDTLNDFEYITQMVELTNFLVVNPEIPADNLKEFIQLAKDNPGKYTYGSAGVGQSNHLSGELLQRDADIELVHVPYRGSAQALTDVVGGAIDGMFVDALSAEPLIKEGRVKLIAATGLERSPSYPDYPTLNESGLPGFNGNTWLGLVVPAGVPEDIVNSLQQAVYDEFNKPETEELLIKQGVVPVASNPAEFKAFVEEEVQRWEEVIKEADIKVEQ